MNAHSILYNLEQRIAAQGLTMAAVCREAGMSQAVVSRWRARKYEPKLSSLDRLEQALIRLARRKSA